MKTLSERLSINIRVIQLAQKGLEDIMHLQVLSEAFFSEELPRHYLDSMEENLTNLIELAERFHEENNDNTSTTINE